MASAGSSQEEWRDRSPSGNGRPAEPSMPSKERVIERIKHNFYLETQSLRQRVHEETEETLRAREKANECQDETRSLKRRCAKLERKLQEKDTAIQFLQNQQQVRFPLLMHETMRSLRSLEDNQGGSTASSTPLSHSLISGKAHERVDADARIHEYEQQIAELYEENQQEKLKNEMLSECLRDQKHAKAKLMKACKHAKQELQAVQDSGLSQMLVDIEARCDSLEKEKAQLVEELQAERSRRGKQEDEREILAKQLEDLLVESSKWDGIIARKDQELRRSRDQICEEQVTIENLKFDLQDADRRMARPAADLQDTHEEIAMLKRTLSQERAEAERTEENLEKLMAESVRLRERLAVKAEEDRIQNGVLIGSAQASKTFGHVLTQIQFLKRRLHALKQLMQVYEETDSVDISLLDETDWDYGDVGNGAAVQTCEEYAACLSGDVSEATQSLSELQQAMEDVCACLMGSSCALQ